MNKFLAAIGLGAAAVIGFAGSAQADYPPNPPGTIDIHDPVCNYVDGSQSQLESWSVTFDYNVTAVDAYMTVVNPFVDDIIWSLEVPVGSGSLTVDHNTPGAGGISSYSGNFFVSLGVGDQSIEAQSFGCLVGDPTEPTMPPETGHLNIEQPECATDVPDGAVVDWSFTVDVYTPSADEFLIIANADASTWYQVPLPQGDSSVVVDSTIAEFSGPLAPYDFYTVILNGVSGTTEASVIGCPMPTDDGTAAPTSTSAAPTTTAGIGAESTTTTPASTTTAAPTTTLASTTTAAPTTTAVSTTTVASQSTSTTSTLAPQTNLPKTGFGAGGLALAALMLLTGGSVLVWVAHRRTLID